MKYFSIGFLSLHLKKYEQFSMDLENFYAVENENILDEQERAQIQAELELDLDAVEAQLQADLVNPDNEFNQFQNLEKFTKCTGNASFSYPFYILKDSKRSSSFVLQSFSIDFVSLRPDFSSFCDSKFAIYTLIIIHKLNIM